jgi:hypothetical protein
LPGANTTEGIPVTSCTDLIKDGFASLNCSLAFLLDRQGAASDATPTNFESDMRYFSKRLWSKCGGCEGHEGFLPCGFKDVFPEWHPKLVLPKVLSDYKDSVDQFAVRYKPRHIREWRPVLMQCRVEFGWNKDGRMKKATISCDAIHATILSLFQTPETELRLSAIEDQTGIPIEILSCYMSELCAKRSRVGLNTGLLEVSQGCHTTLHLYQLTFFVLRRLSAEMQIRPIVFTPGEHGICNR